MSLPALDKVFAFQPASFCFNPHDQLTSIHRILPKHNIMNTEVFTNSSFMLDLENSNYFIFNLATCIRREV